MMTSITPTNSARLIWFSNQSRKQVPGAAICPAAAGSFPALSFRTQRINGVRDKVIKATQAVKPNDDSRPLANFHPNIWGDRFLLSDLETDQLIKSENELSLKVGALTQDLKIKLKEIDQCPLEQLKLVDTIQRLGIDYHFEKEINQALQDIHDNYLDFHKSNNDLYSNALAFRLLRQHGYNVSCGIFEKFKNDKGEFKDSITSDVMGMLEFYEATFLSIEDEDVLDHGRAFTSAHLHAILPNLNNTTIGKQVLNALEQSNRRGFPRLETRKYISIYEQQASSCNENLLKLAKLDFNRLQYLHKRELSEFNSWWKGFDVPKNFFYARDRCVEMYIFTMGVYFEPQYDVARKYSSRILILLSLLDDIYDAYGTFEELQIFTEAIESWNWSIPNSNSLPLSMEVLYKAMLELFKDIEDEVVDGEQRASYVKEIMKRAALAYFEEVKWRETKYIPKTTEYMKVATKSSSALVTLITSYIGMGDIVTKEFFHWLFTYPVEFKAWETFGRLIDDVAGHEFDKNREHVPSMVDCYVEEHGVHEQQAKAEINKQIEIAWKEFNGKLLMLANFPAALLHRPLNLFRMTDVFYKKDDYYTHVGPEMQSFVKQVLIDPVPE